jgi:hypothetical protein
VVPGVGLEPNGFSFVKETPVKENTLSLFFLLIFCQSPFQERINGIASIKIQR